LNRISFINKDFIALIVVTIISSIIFFSNNSKYVERIESKIIDLFSTLLYPQQWYKNILVIKKENELLKQNIVQLKLFNAKLNNYKIENDKLRDMLSFKDAYNKISLQPANIVNHNFIESPNSVIIDIGNDYEISKNQAVIDLNGLLGKTITIGSHASKVQVVTDKNFAVSVKVGADMQLAIFKPTNSKFGILEGVIKSVDLKPGDIVYTSGISEIYPSDIPVCRVVSSSNDKDKPFLNVIVEVLADISNLNYVFVIQ